MLVDARAGTARQPAVDGPAHDRGEIFGALIYYACFDYGSRDQARAASANNVEASSSTATWMRITLVRDIDFLVLSRSALSKALAWRCFKRSPV